MLTDLPFLMSFFLPFKNNFKLRFYFVTRSISLYTSIPVIFFLHPLRCFCTKFGDRESGCTFSRQKSEEFAIDHEWRN